VRRRSPRMAAIAAALACVLGPATGAWAAASTEPGVHVTLDRTRIATRLGANFTVRAKITNEAGTAARGLIAHLNVLSLRPGVYVDPEDWSSSRTRYLPPLPPHGSTTLVWHIQAVNAGRIGVYVAVTSRSGVGAPHTGPLARVLVTEHRTLNSGGILPLALGIPAVLAMLSAGLRVRRRRALAA
jgi:hypothetical protein